MTCTTCLAYNKCSEKKCTGIPVYALRKEMWPGMRKNACNPCTQEVEAVTDLMPAWGTHQDLSEGRPEMLGKVYLFFLITLSFMRYICNMHMIHIHITI